MSLRSDHPHSPAARPARLNLLLSCGSWRSDSAVKQLPQLLEPMGVHAIRVNCGREAEQVITSTPIHIAVVDMAIPLTDTESTEPCGPRILQLLRRITPNPPTVLVRPAQAESRASSRSLSQALKEGAFAVVDRPLHMESMLDIMHRILKRHYKDTWPTDGQSPTNN